ncbi:MAG TPA: FAD-dependent monooxygenase [Polyangiaceae bacterium]|nr:FAD-dependent monooxygenase [Polyangiaceae bacterium]
MAQVGRIWVLGGGIAGLSAAIALGIAGFHAEVFEQSPELREVGAGVGLWSNAMASLEELGAADAVRRACTPLRTVAGANARGQTLSRTSLDALGAEFAAAACFVVLRPALLAALVARLPTESIHTGCRANRLELLEDRVRVHFADGRVEDGDLLVGADGLHSLARSLVVGEDRVRYSGQTCFRGVARYRAHEPDVLREIQGAGQRGAVCPVDAETVYWWAAHNAPAETLLEPGARKAHLLTRYRGWPFGLEQAISATPDDAILQHDLVDRAPARLYARGRVILTGDAAHPTTPNLGQGANMAIDDAIVLARALRDEGTLAAARERYERERMPRTRQIVERSWSFGQMCRWESALAVSARELMVRMTPPGVMRGLLRSQILESVGRL